MIKNLLFILPLNLALLSSAISFAQSPSQKSQEAKGFNKELLINIQGDTIAGYAFIADGVSKKATAIIIKGYPGNDSNFDLALALRENGINAILFNHRGAWGSQGKYLYSNCLKDVGHVIDHLMEPENSQNLRIDTDKFILIGRSLGGGVALISGSQINNVEKIIGISNVNYGDLMLNYSQVNELKHYSRYMKKQIMMNHDINEFLEELIVHKKEFKLENYSEALALKKVFLIEDTHKNDHWIKKVKNAEIRYLDSDHNFTDQRNLMIEEILSWLKKKDHYKR